MVHPCDGEAWQEFDAEYPDFARDPRNVGLVIVVDGFTPFSTNAASYSCWPVFVAPLNLPPGILLRPEYIFLIAIVPGPEHPGRKLNGLMQPLVDELQTLWVGVDTLDASLKQCFPMKAAYLWSVHDFLGYGDFSGWSTHGKLACPCGYGCKGFQLRHGHRPCWFDCHRHFLPQNLPFRNQANAFCKNTKVIEEAPRRLSGRKCKPMCRSL
jgi:hypothetical protein